jgi:hypothetical protein
VRRQEISHLGYPGAETPKLIYPLNSLWGFASRDFTMCDDKRSLIWVSQESKLRSSYIYAKLISGFRKSGFRDMRIQGNLPLGIPGAETSKHQTLTMLYHFRVSQVGISRHEKTRKLALGYPGCRNAKTPNSNHAIPFRGFASRDFTTCEDKETCPWVS